MRLRLFTIYSVLLIVALASLCACSKRAPIVIMPDDEKQPTYTIIYYAVGGATLDKAIEESIAAMAKGGLPENVALSGCIKWTKGYASELSNGEGNVYRFRLDGKQSTIELEQIGDNNYPMHEPENIADFIRWSKEVAPADNYILVLAGHGNGWHPQVNLTNNQEYTRGTLRDTDLDRYTSLEELSQGIANSQTHFRMIHMVSCLMNNVEYITSLAPYCDYILGSSHISVMLCSELRFLKMALKEIDNNSTESFVEAMQNYFDYIEADIEGKNDLEAETLDFALTDTREVEALNRGIAQLASHLNEIYDEGNEGGIATLEEAIAQSYYFISAHIAPEDMATTEYLRMAFTYDLVDIAHRAAAAINDDQLKEIASTIKTQAESTRILHYSKSLNDIDDVYYGITLTNSTLWAERGYSEAGYEETPFDKATGWSRFLKRNNIAVAY